jgi:dTDP-glucose 4,6-dehydratase
MQKILITGSTGFIGSNLLRQITHNKLPYQICSIDKISSNINSIYWNKNHNFYMCDITDQHILNNIFDLERVDTVIHLASETREELSNTSLIDSYINNNVLGTQKVLNACHKFGVKKIIYVSTQKVYQESDEAIYESSESNPKCPFSSSKFAGEILVKSAYHINNLSYNILRLTNIYGPRQNKDKFVPKVIKSIIEKSKMSHLDSAMCNNDWIHISDAISAIVKVLEDGADNEIYNVSSLQQLSNLELAQKISNIVSEPHHIQFEMKVGREYNINSNKLRLLGWEPKTKLMDGLISTSEWYLNNKYFIK